MGAQVLVGVSCDWTPFVDARGARDCRHQLADAYVHALAAAGAATILLPHQAPAHADACLAPLDALVISGGDMDVPPEFFGEVPAPGLGRVVAGRSAFERALVEGAARRRLPVLGICGGMQLMNALGGGTLVNHPGPARGGIDHQQPHDRHRPHHPVRLAANSRLAAALADAEGRPPGELWVNSTHHQVVGRTGDSLRAVAWAPDGAIEAIEAEGGPFYAGVQWHPEVMGPPVHWRIYASLVAAAEAAAGG